MSSLFNTFFKIVLTLSLFTIGVSAESLSKDSFLKVVANYVGSYDLVGKASEFCRAGRLDFVSSKKPQEGLILSNKLFFGPFVESSIDMKEDGHCTVTEAYEYSKSLLRQVTKVHKCETKNISEEGISTQEMHFSKNTIIYKSLESKIECTFKKNKSGEKI